MPTYEYRCPDGHDFERFLKMSEATPTLACPVCGKTAVRVISGGAGLVFKGSGFYITDYGKDGKKDYPKPAATTSASSGESKGDAKSTDSKSGDSGTSSDSAKSGDSKSGDAKPATTKPAATTGSGKSGSGTTE